MTGTVLTAGSGASPGASPGAVRSGAVVVRTLAALGVPVVAVVMAAAVTGVGSSRPAQASQPPASPLVVGHSSGYRAGTSGPAVLDPALVGQLGPAWSGTLRPAGSGPARLARSARDSGCCSAPIAFIPEWPVGVR